MDLPEGSLLAKVPFGPEEEERLTGLAVIPVMNAGATTLLAGQLLHPAELATAAAFASEVRRRSYISGRIAAKLAIRQVFPGLTGPEINITANKVGKPVAGGLPESHAVSISHSDHHGAAVCFPAAFPMGIDIETPEEKNRPVISSILSGEELAFLQTHQDSLQCLHVLWTAKEAAGKATGLGFRLPVEKYEIAMIRTIADNENRSWVCNFRQITELATISREWQGAMLTLAFPSEPGRQPQVYDSPESKTPFHEPADLLSNPDAKGIYMKGG